MTDSTKLAEDLLKKFMEGMDLKSRLNDAFFEQEYLCSFMPPLALTEKDIIEIFRRDQLPARFIKFKTAPHTLFIHTNIYDMREELIQYLRDYLPLGLLLYFKQDWDVEGWDDDFIQEKHKFPYRKHYLTIDELNITNTEKFMMED